MRARHTTVRLIAMLVIGVIVAVVAGVLGFWQYAPIIGWAAAALAYVIWVWIVIARFDSEQTQSHASQEEPARGVADALVVLLSLASLVAVGFLLVQASQTHGTAKGLLAGLALVSVALSWALLHTLFALRYARLYYPQGTGIDFNNDDEKPRYSDFAYFSFNLGMTYQVSDTAVTSHAVRMTAFRHCLLSFLFGSVILASTINLIAGLS